MQEYGAMYVAGGSTAQTLSTDYEKVTGWAVLGDNSYYEDGNPGIRAHLAQDRFALLPGRYLVMISLHGKTDTPDVVHTFGVHVDAAEQVDLVAVTESEAAAKNDLNVSITGILTLTSSAAVDLRAKSASATPAFTPISGNFTILKLE